GTVRPRNCIHPSPDGVKRVGSTTTPGSVYAASRRIRLSTSNQGAPMYENGSLVPRPSDSAVASRLPSPEKWSAASRERMLGDGFTQGSPVASYQSERFHPSSGTTVSCAPTAKSAFT